MSNYLLKLVKVLPDGDTWEISTEIDDEFIEDLNNRSGLARGLIQAMRESFTSDKPSISIELKHTSQASDHYDMEGEQIEMKADT